MAELRIVRSGGSCFFAISQGPSINDVGGVGTGTGRQVLVKALKDRWGSMIAKQTSLKKSERGERG